MKQKSVPGKQPAEDVIRDIRRAIRLHSRFRLRPGLFVLAQVPKNLGQLVHGD